jgi:integrase
LLVTSFQSGRPLPAAQAQLGHESIQTTSDGCLDRSSGQANADVIGSLLS